MADWDMGAVREKIYGKNEVCRYQPATLYVSLNGMKGSILTITEAVMKALSHKSSTKEGPMNRFLKGAMILTLAGIIVKVIGAFSKVLIARVLGGELAYM